MVNLSGVELSLVACVMVLLVMLVVQTQRLSNLRERTDRMDLPDRADLPEQVIGFPAPSTGSGLSPDVEQEVLRLLEQRKTIMAIKLVRESTGLGLKEAKDLVERF